MLTEPTSPPLGSATVATGLSSDKSRTDAVGLPLVSGSVVLPPPVVIEKVSCTVFGDSVFTSESR